jgi:hypothetical protein
MDMWTTVWKVLWTKAKRNVIHYFAFCVSATFYKERLIFLFTWINTHSTDIMAEMIRRAVAVLTTFQFTAHQWQSLVEGLDALTNSDIVL